MSSSEYIAAVDLLRPFEKYATAASAQVSVAATQEEAAAIVLSLAIGELICTAAVAELYAGLFKALEGAGHHTAIAEDIAEAESDPQALAVALSGGTGIVVAQAGLAETGSVVLADDALAPRLLSMLSEVCIVLLDVAHILPGLDQAGVLLAELDRTGHRYISLVTGPSRTADIERVLTIGVQGPKTLHIIVVMEEGS